MMNCWFQLSTVDSYVMTGGDYIYSGSMRVTVCVFCVGSIMCVCVCVCLLAGSARIMPEYGGQRMTDYYSRVDMHHMFGKECRLSVYANRSK